MIERPGAQPATDLAPLETEVVDASIVVKCYRHAAFIEQAIRSVAGQETGYRFEIIVSDDGSDDASPEIIRRLGKEYPGLVRGFYRQPAQAHFVKGRRSGNANLLSALAECRGRYVAILDGDDYWTEPSKLQRQISFLEGNKGFVAVAHPVENVDASGRRLGIVPLATRRGVLTNAEIGRGIKPHISSFMVRADRLPLPGWFMDLEYTDWPFMVWMTGEGQVSVLPEPMTAYRLHPGGMWSGSAPVRDHLRARNVARSLSRHLGDAPVCREIARFEVYQILKIAREFRRQRRPARARRALGTALGRWRTEWVSLGLAGNWRCLREALRSVALLGR